MSARPDPGWFLALETRGLLARLDRLKPFVLQESMLPAALLLPRSLVGIECTLLNGRDWLRDRGRAFLEWLHGPGREAHPTEQQRRFVRLRSDFNNHLSQLDLFSHAITQRSESELGVWLSGLDLAAEDGLTLPGDPDRTPPPVICYVDRGAGAAIRRVATRLPGGVPNPVALVRIPRERMIGHGIASSLMHEVGHQGAALLDLVPSLKAELRERERASTTKTDQLAWRCWRTWISEIVADFWSVAKVGAGSTLGLMAVVSFPPVIVYRFTLSDPHPLPWIRVLTSAAIGNELYPHEQWSRLVEIWKSLYPIENAPADVRARLQSLERRTPTVARAIADHRPAKGGGATLRELVASPDREADNLRGLYTSWQRDARRARKAPPGLHFAVLGQARLDGRLSPENECRQVDRLLHEWAMRTTLTMAEAHARLDERLNRRPWAAPVRAIA